MATSRLRSLCLTLLLSFIGWPLSVHALEAPIPVGRLPTDVVFGRPIRDRVEDSEEPSVSTAQLPPLPADMRLPCSNPDRACVQSIDATYQPQPPAAAGSSCNVTLMPWSPFPCRYDATKVYGVPGQKKIDYCYENPSAADPSLGSAGLAQKLKFKLGGADGYFLGLLPSSLCPGLTAGQTAGQTVDVVKLLVNIDFRVASGIQYDRGYMFKIGEAMAVKGTTAEPAVFEADKAYSVTADVTHLLSYMKPGMQTKFSLGNFVSNQYNVPVWAAITMQVYYNTGGSKPSGSASSELGYSSSAAVPTEVLPLPDASLSGSGDSPSAWPNQTYQLSVLTQPGNIYRAQLLVTPQWGGCEEFWALQPSGKQTGTACNKISAGEPYRELRVYVDGQLAGLYPVFFAFYTGGLDPSLWMAIVAPHAYLLPSYTFDLSPFLGVLNSAGKVHSISIEAVGVTNDNWQVSASLLLWRSSTLKISGKPPIVKLSPSAASRVTSSCNQVTSQPLSVQGQCTVKIESRSVSATSQLTVGNVRLAASSLYEVTSHVNQITYDNKGGGEVFGIGTSGKAAWSLALAPASRARSVARRRRAVSPATTVTAVSAAFKWGLSGGLVTGITFVMSDNATVGPSVMATLDTVVSKSSAGQATTFTSAGGSQKHYLRARMPATSESTQEFGLCPMPPKVTATVSLNSTVNTMTWVPGADCVSRSASAAFCFSQLLSLTAAATPGACKR